MSREVKQSSTDSEQRRNEFSTKRLIDSSIDADDDIAAEIIPLAVFAGVAGFGDA